MDGAHDLGGMHGFGRVPVEAEAPGFDEPWERRVWYLADAVGARTTVDRFRHAIELMPPAEYLTTRYYGRWLWALERLAADPELLARPGGIAHPPPGQPVPAARFAAGDDVRVRNAVTPLHTRVPRYLRRLVGRVEGVALAWPNPTASAAAGVYGEAEAVYRVAFDAGAAFGPPADHVITADLAESDLENP
ncbi:MAG: SH3-like domain-containing protein [Acidimicrobiales bacterium]